VQHSFDIKVPVLIISSCPVLCIPQLICVQMFLPLPPRQRPPPPSVPRPPPPQLPSTSNKKNNALSRDLHHGHDVDHHQHPHANDGSLTRATPTASTHTPASTSSDWTSRTTTASTHQQPGGAHSSQAEEASVSTSAHSMRTHNCGLDYGNEKNATQIQQSACSRRNDNGNYDGRLLVQSVACVCVCVILFVCVCFLCSQDMGS
jgi:hypothetical protein